MNVRYVAKALRICVDFFLHSKQMSNVNDDLATKRRTKSNGIETRRKWILLRMRTSRWLKKNSNKNQNEQIFIFVSLF